MTGSKDPDTKPDDAEETDLEAESTEELNRETEAAKETGEAEEPDSEAEGGEEADDAGEPDTGVDEAEEPAGANGSEPEEDESEEVEGSEEADSDPEVANKADSETGEAEEADDTEEPEGAEKTDLKAEEPDFDRQWEEIVSSLDFPDLSDLPSRLDPSSTYEQVAADFLDLDAHMDDDPPTVATITSRASGSSRASGPRDWVPEEEDEDESFDEDIVTLMPADDDSPTSPVTRLLWIASAASFLTAALSIFGLFGSSTVVLVAGAAGFILAAGAAFSSAPRAEDVDPFDDGARV